MDIEVKMGEVVVANGADNLVVFGVGSCLVITLYDPKLKVGACAHAMLPLSIIHNLSSITEHGKRDARYVDVAIDEMLKRSHARPV